jgi:acyl transferase domain-containing protein
LPPTIKVKEPHPKLVGSPFILSDKARPWVGKKDSPRRAAVSAFGFGGSNYHAVLEEFQAEKTALDWDPEVQVLAFAAGNKAGLLTAVQNANGLLQKGLCPRGLGRHLRTQFQSEAAERLTFVVKNSVQLQERLAAAEDYLKAEGAQAPAWLYHGQGCGARGTRVYLCGSGFAGTGDAARVELSFSGIFDEFAAGE